LSDEELASMFKMDGKEARSELMDRAAAGDIYIGSENCDGFDPINGCPGHKSEESALYLAAKRQMPNYDIDYYLEILFTFPEEEWFTPTNGDEKTQNSAYTICHQLYHANLICAKYVPLWGNGSYKGQSIAFYYSKKMDYKAYA
jgi:hypothetical protein